MRNFLKKIFTVKKTPKQDKIVVDKKTQNKANLLVLIGFILLLANLIFGLFKVLFFSGLQSSVHEFDFTILIISIIILFVMSWVSLASLLNGKINILIGFKESKGKRISLTLISLLFSVYISFFSVNEAGLLGSYNKHVQNSVCEVINQNGQKSETCKNYEIKMTEDTSLWARLFYFL